MRGTTVICISLASVILAYVVTEVQKPPVEHAKIPEDTTELTCACAEWFNHPNDAPRMCFAVLERMWSNRDDTMVSRRNGEYVVTNPRGTVRCDTP